MAKSWKIGASYLAIDFETSGNYPGAACAIGLVRVEKQEIVGTEYRLIRPPKKNIRFTNIHGITWNDLQHEPDFGEVWDDIAHWFDGVDFIAAHNAGFDKSVLRGCADIYCTEPPHAPYVCTVRLARKIWNLRPTRLPDVCSFLGIELDHHNAMSDAEACASILLAAEADGWVQEDRDLMAGISTLGDA